MDIHGFHLVSKLDADSEEGFSTTVTHPDKRQIRGPFGEIAEAVKCAHAWSLEDHGAVPQACVASRNTESAMAIEGTLPNESRPEKPVESPEEESRAI